MTVTRLELSTFCKNQGWRGDSNALWHALDNDESGATSLDEFAGVEARQLALFKSWVDKNFGGVKGAIGAFAAKCKKKGMRGKHAKSFDKHDFVYACRVLGFEHDAADLFDILDWDVEGDSHLTFKDLRFLDTWEPVEWLTAEADQDEADAFKDCLINKYRHPMKAWRALDEDGSGKVNFKEFQATAVRVGFKGNLCGAWMALDSDASGYIAFQEIDGESAGMLASFRRWANLHFGSVMDAFRVLDSDGGGSLSRAEFKKSVTKYGFRGDREGLFTLLDVACDGDISLEEMAFLDEWEISEVSDEAIPSFQEVEEMLKKNAHDSDESDSEDDMDCHEYQQAFEQMQKMREKREFKMLAEDEIPILKETVHKPMPGTALVELLGVFSPRTIPLPVPSAHETSFMSSSGHETSFMSSSTFSIMPNAHETSFMSSSAFSKTSSQMPSRFSARGVHRPRNFRLRKSAPYTGGAPFMSPSTARASRRTAHSRPQTTGNLPTLAWAKNTYGYRYPR